MKVFRSRLGLAAALCAQAISLPASAADLSVPRAPLYAKAPPIVSAGYDWSGFYAGAHAGYEWGRAHVIDNGVLTENAVPMDGSGLDQAVGGVTNLASGASPRLSARDWRLFSRPAV